MSFYIRFLLLIVMVKCTTSVHYKCVQGRESTMRINLDSVKWNYERLISKLPPKHPVMGVVKGNAYGMGAVAVSRTLLRLGAKYLAVAIVDEGVYLRKHGIKAPILVLGYTAAFGQGIDLAIRYSLTLNVFSIEVLNAIQKKVRNSALPVKIHIKVNTGLSRLGIEPDEVVPFVKLIKYGFYPNIEVEGIFSHFGYSDAIEIESLKKYATQQLKIFKKVVGKVREIMNIPIAHIANSNGVEYLGEEAHLDMVRPGSSILGFRSFAKPPLSLSSIVTDVRKPAAGMQIGYRENVTATGNQWIAAVPLGYADGLRPECGDVGRVLIKGTRVPIVSGIMMDQMLVDVTEVYPVAAGEPVVIIGRQGSSEIRLEDIVKMCGGTEYSWASQLSKRIPRVYVKKNRVVYCENDMLTY